MTQTALISLIVGFAMGSAALAESQKSGGVTDPTVDISTPDRQSRFALAPGMVEKIHAANSREVAEETTRLEVDLSVGLFRPQELSVESDKFRLDYHDQLEEVGVAELSFGAELAKSGEFSTHVDGAVGFGQILGAYEADSTTGLALEDNVSLQWMPLAAAIRGEYAPGLVPVRPFAVVGGTANWLHQSGDLDGMEVSLWVPGWITGVGLALFGSDDPRRGFGGVIVRSLYGSAAGGGASMKGFTHTVGTAFLL